MKYLICLILLCVFNTPQSDIPTESITMLDHYINGEGSDLIFEFNYLPKSPMIKKNLKKS
jgi:hypothetical protein